MTIQINKCRSAPRSVGHGLDGTVSRIELRSITANAEWFNSLLTTEVEDAYWTPAGILYDRQTALTLPSVGVELG